MFSKQEYYQIYQAMNSITESTKVRNACMAAVEAFKKLNKPEYSDLISKLEYCIASYDFDQNPVGLFEYAAIAHQMLSEVKKNSPRKVSKKLLDDLEKSIVD
jgi:hypothetical protein